MKVLITGASGQLGYELQRSAPAAADVVATDVQELDICDAAAVNAFFESNQPTHVINGAAYTNVDKAEEDEALAHRINAVGAGNIAKSAAKHGAKLIQISTDFIFDGTASKPYLEDATPKPLSVYGATKLAGEIATREANASSIIIRTAWVYSAHGNNFVKTMIRLMNERKELGIIADQVGTPTWANGLASACWKVFENNLSGKTFHWTDAGVATWYDFAVAIYHYGQRFDLIKNDVRINPIPTSAYPTPAERPHYSVLDKSTTWEALQYQPHHWGYQLRQMLKELVNE